MKELLAKGLISERELAEQLGVSLHTVRRWRYNIPPDGPPVRKVGRSVRYSVAEVEAWLDEQQDPWWRDE